MPASLRELRQRRKSVMTTKKITRAMELIAASRIVKAQQRATAAAPYARELTRAVSAVATYSDIEHPLTTERKVRTNRAAVLIITSDRGLAGAYSSSVLRQADGLTEKLRGEGKEVVHYIAGRKGVQFFTFRKRPIARSWEGDSDEPTYAMAREMADELLAAFLDEDLAHGVDEIHIVFTRFVSMLTQRPEVVRMLPLEVVESAAPTDKSETLPIYEFEPDAETVLDALLPLYVANRIQFCLLQSAASELASRQKAMKSATDNAQQLIDSLTREANQARQAEITQEITEIVGGAAALSETNAEND